MLVPQNTDAAVRHQTTDQKASQGIEQRLKAVEAAKSQRRDHSPENSCEAAGTTTHQSHIMQ